MGSSEHEMLSGSELLESQAHIWNHLFSFINSMSLKCAVQLGIPDIIHNHGKPMTLSQIISSSTPSPNNTTIHPSKAPCLYRLMRILVHSGFFNLHKVLENNQETEAYSLTNYSKLLLKDSPFNMSPLLLCILDPTLTQPWNNLNPNWFQNHDPSVTPFQVTHGMSFWEYGVHGSKLGSLFNEAMANDARLVMSIVIDKFKKDGVLEGLESFVDVGGGTGSLAKEIADAFPHMECTVLDLPHVVAGLPGITNNMKLIAGDMFHSVPPGDSILLKWILHDWSDEESVRILKRCKEAISKKGNKKGKVIVIDIVVTQNKEKGMPDDDNKKWIETQLFFDMLMMVMVTGKEREENEWAKLFYDAGFSSYKIIPLLGLRSLIEVYP